MQPSGVGGTEVSRGLARFRSAPATWLEALLESEDEDDSLKPSQSPPTQLTPTSPVPGFLSSGEPGLFDSGGAAPSGLGFLRQNSSPADFLTLLGSGSEGYFPIPSNYDDYLLSPSIDISPKRPRRADSSQVEGEQDGNLQGRVGGLPDGEMDKHFEYTVPCKIRAKRGHATHPRSIAERVRRTRISDRIRKLQELVPNMDKQTNTADMLDEAVEYVKLLQKQIQVNMLPRVTLLLYWGGGVVETDEGMSYDTVHKCSIVVSNTIKYDELLRKLNGNRHVSLEGRISRMVCRWPRIVRPHHPVVYSSLVIDDDDTVESMLQIVQDGVFRHVDLYLEFFGNGSEPLAREHNVSTIGNEYVVGVDARTASDVPSSLINTRENGENIGNSSDSHRYDNMYAPSGTCDVENILEELIDEDDEYDDGGAFFDECEDVERDGDSNEKEFHVQQSVKMHQPMSEIFTQIDMEAADAPYADGTRPYLLGSEWDPLTHEPTIGLLFPSKASVIRAIQIYSVSRNRQCFTKESKKHTLLFICLKLQEEKCSWRLRATCKKRRGNQWEISRYKGPHTCLYMVEGSDHTQMTSKFVAHLIEQQVKVNPELSIAEVILAVKSRSINITKRKASIAKSLAIQSVFGNWEESYNELPRFMIAMKHYNPGTIVVYDSVNTATCGEVQFKYMFWAMSGSIAGFSHCRPIVAIDGTFLKGKYKGVLLIANSVDANGQIFPLAFAIVDTESAASWGFFLRCLRTHVVKDRLGICLISDRGNSIRAAVNRRQNGWGDDPYGVFHCHCIRHYKANFVKKFKSEMLGDLMMQAAKKHQVRKFDRVMEAIKAIDETAERWLRTECPLEKWTLSHDKGRRHGQLTSNLVESLNSVLKGPRALPIMALVQCIFYKISEFFAQRYKKASIAFEESEMSVTPSVYEQISTWQKKAGTHILQAHHLQQGIYTILTQRRPRGGGNIQTVQLSQRYCSCGKWVVYQIPCSHVIAVCQTLGYNWKQYVGDMLYVRTWKQIYEHTIMPIAHEDYWPRYNGPLYKPDPSLRRGKGRPKKNRIASDMDLIVRKRKRIGVSATSAPS